MASPPSSDLLAQIAKAANELGFVKVGFTPIPELKRGTEALQRWLSQGFHGDMDYMARHGLRDDPQKMLSEAKGVIVVALPYARDDDTDARLTPLRGVVARYARGPDYHYLLKEKLSQLAETLSDLLKSPVLSRPCVDTAPLLERELAEAAGVGFVAKSTMTLIPGVGTYTLLGELLVNIELPKSVPMETKCGECVACLDACPTKAFVGPWVLDARRCISYLTIESNQPIPRELRAPIGDRIFGCDICQEVCPFNASPKPRPGDPSLAPFPHLQAPELATLLNLRSGEYRRFVKGTALRRASRAQLGRNAALALGNSPDPQAVPILVEALHHNTSPLVRGHVAWALGQHGGEVAREALTLRLETEEDDFVQSELRAALEVPSA